MELKALDLSLRCRFPSSPPPTPPQYWHTHCVFEKLVASTQASLPSCFIVKVKEVALIKVSEAGDKGLGEER